MAAVVVESSSPSSIESGRPTITQNDELLQSLHAHFDPPHPSSNLASLALHPFGDTENNRERRKRRIVGEEEEEEGENKLPSSVLGLFVTAFSKSVIRCYRKEGQGEREGSVACCWAANKMEIGLPSNVKHVAHVTFDRFNGFLGLPVEFEPHVPRRPPSASAKVFGVSTNSMQLSLDSRGNSVPSILVMMQRRLYALGGLEVEGIFRITAGNAQEEYVRDELNRGVIPDDADVHCLSGLIKAWFRELPVGVLDCVSPEQLMKSETEEECMQLARSLPLTEACLLDWAINLMADIAHFQHLNKMNPRNVALVFAPNMTHVLDPLTALMHAVQVMNFLKTLIVTTLRERQDAVLDTPLIPPSLDLHVNTPLHMILQGFRRRQGLDDQASTGSDASRDHRNRTIGH